MRSFLAGAFPFEKLEHLLGAIGEVELDGSAKRRYPSAGGLYPVQAYVHLKEDAVEGVHSGLYYFDPVRHELQLLAGEDAIRREIHVPDNRPVFDGAALSIFLVGDLDAIRPMYGDLARDFSLFEAGSMTQLLMEAAAEVSLGLCPIGVVAFGGIQHHFQTGANHVLLHTLAGGVAAPETSRAAAAPEMKRVPVVESIRDHVAARLPHYMVPSKIVIVDALPLSRNGKIDRAALLELEPKAETRPAVAPAAGLEKTLQAIVQAVLHVDDIDPNRNLFDLGANSIDLVQMHARAQESTGIEFSVVDLFQHPSIHALARHLDGRVAVPKEDSAQARAANRRDALSRRSLRVRTSPDSSPDA